MNLSRLTPTTMAVAIAAVVFVQTPTSLAQGRSLLEEVVVTAQKREQNVQDVGISITAFSGEQLDALGFNESSELR